MKCATTLAPPSVKMKYVRTMHAKHVTVTMSYTVAIPPRRNIMFTIGTMRLGLFQDGPEARAKPIPFSYLQIDCRPPPLCGWAGKPLRVHFVSPGRLARRSGGFRRSYRMSQHPSREIAN